MHILRALTVSAAFFFPLLAQTDNVLHPGTAVFDRPTLASLGIQLPVTGDDNYNSTVAVQYRRRGDIAWKIALPLFRVHPDTTLPYVIAPQFAGSILDLRPATTYEIQLHIADPDGPVDQIVSLTGTTRALPTDPATPRVVNVANATDLNAALGNVQPGDIITLANGTYSGSFFSVFKSGTAANPIVVRGASEDGVIVDGANCGGCNIFELYGSYIHLERMTLQNAERAIKFASPATQGNVVRRVHIKNTILGITGRENQLDFYIADNILEGRLPWPQIYTVDDGLHAADDGINVSGAGHVVAHNQISGYGKAVISEQPGARAIDIYSNDVRASYDAAIKFGFLEGNGRIMRNRLTNVYMGVSLQPVASGPVYVYRNVASNVVNEQFKMHPHANPITEPNGVFAFNNTFVDDDAALILETAPNHAYHFAIENNLFIGPLNPQAGTPYAGTTVDWYSYIVDGLFDYNGYWPDGKFGYLLPSQYLQVPSFAALQAAGAGLEVHGLLVTPQTLASGAIGQPDYHTAIAPSDFTLAVNSPALDKGLVIPNISDQYTGAAPDIGAIELGCAAPIYGPRPEGVDESNELYGCSGTSPVPVAQSISIVSGTPQSALLLGSFSPFKVKVLNAAQQPVPGMPVTFTAPSSGASGTFAGATSATVGTDAAGIATSPAFAANTSLGSYVVSATAGALSPVTFSLTNTLPAPPTADSETGPAGVRINQPAVFTFKYSSPGGAPNITQASVLMNTANSGANGCSIVYNQASNVLYLRNDADTANLAALTPGSVASVQNSQCTLSGAGTTVTGSGLTLTLALNLSFTQAFLGTRQIFMSAQDQGAQTSGWQNRGSVNISLPDLVLHPGTPGLDRPTLISLGVQLPITGDENFNASVTMQYRKAGDTAWKQAQPLYRVHPDTTLPYVIAPQFAGSILDLRPATTYEIQLHAVDPDGSVDQVLSLTGTTRPVPGDPATPRIVNVSNANMLGGALDGAQPGDIITLADGVYTGQFALGKSGTATNPIVIRGTSIDGTVIDGQNCSGCNVLEIYASYIHIERLTVQSGERGIRFQTAGSQGNVVRRVRVWNVQQGVGSKSNQLDFYIADNSVEGLVTWPNVYPDDGGAQDVYDGIHVEGSGHVIAHNRISGFGDGMKTAQNGARAIDFYGNDILWDYDSGVELDGSEGNVRLMRNRFTNTFNPISAQPIFGGPAYIYRNTAMNTVYEELKLHSASNPTREPNGIFIYNNTFVSAYGALILETPTAVHHFALLNNLFIGPRAPVDNRPVDFYAFIDDGLFDYNGYWPDGFYSYNYRSGRINANNFAALQQAGAGLEPHGLLVNPQTLASGIVGPDNYKVFFSVQDFKLAPNSIALDRGTALPNITDGYTGAAPDLGALEAGCPAPVYGPRPLGTDETNEVFGCDVTTVGGVAATITANAGTPQSIAVQTAAATALQAKVLDALSKPVSGVKVTFTAPASGGSGAFAGSATATATTDVSGIATAPAFTANATAGAYTVTAAATGVVATASFSLTNTAPVPASLTAVSGTPQTVTVQAAFAPLQVKVLDSASKPVAGVKVTFTAPSIGASATFAGGAATATATTDSSGIATAPLLTANSTAGAFTGLASFGNLTPASFLLTSAQGILLPATLAVNPGEQTTLTVTLSQAAPSGGVFVSLASSDDSVLSLNVPTVLIREGQTNSNPVRLNGNAVGFATVTAKATGFNPGTTQVQVGTPPGTMKLTPATTTISAPGSQNLTLTLTPAPASAVSVALASSNAAAATVPATVAVAAGATTAMVPVSALGSGTTTITATLGNYAPASATVTVTATSGLAVTTASLASGQVNTPYSQVLDAAGGTKPYNWTLTSGTLPNNLTLNSSLGWIGGTPTVAVTNIPLTFQVTDSSTPTLTATANFTLTIAPPGGPASIAALAGTPQSTNVNTAFPTLLSVVVKDASSNPVNGATVTFAAPSSGASGTFAGGVNTAVTNAAGIAVAPVFTANGSGGTYAVTATVAGVATPATFALTNVSGPSVVLPATLSVNPGEQAQLQLGLTIAAPPGGVFVTLSSSNNSVTSLNIPAVLIPEGEKTSSRVRISGLGLGTAAITASALGFASATTQVQVGASGGTMSLSPATVTVGVFSSQNLTLALSPPAPAGGLTISLSSTNPAVASISGASLFVAGNASSVTIPVNGLTPGSSTISASAPGYGSASAGVTVSSGLSIATPALASGKAGVLYTQPLDVTGGTRPLNWSVAAGTLPSGLMFDAATGVIGGTPSIAVNAAPLTIKVTDSSTPQQSATANFTLTIASAQAGGGTSIAALSGTPQTAGVGTAFSSPLVVLVKDANGNPVSGVVVTFTLPSSGASASFAGGVNTATTNGAGIATSVPLTANAIAGSYAVTASAPNVGSPASFSLNNVSGPAILVPLNVTIAAGEQAAFPVTLSVPAPAGGIFLSVASSNPSVVTPNAANVLIPEGQTSSSRVRLNGVGGGSATITVSAPGFQAGTAQVQVGN